MSGSIRNREAYCASGHTNTLTFGFVHSDMVGFSPLASPRVEIFCFLHLVQLRLERRCVCRVMLAWVSGWTLLSPS